MGHPTGPGEPPGEETYRVLQLLGGPRRRIRGHLPLPWRRRLAVFLGGTIGGVARLAVSAGLPGDGEVPWGTLTANVTGALLLGYLLTRFLRAAPRTTLTIPLVCTGTLGAYTTFSTFSVETVELVADGSGALALAYAGGSVLVGLLAAAAGIRLAERRP